jgi:hypothetical protein
MEWTVWGQRLQSLTRQKGSASPPESRPSSKPNQSSLQCHQRTSGGLESYRAHGPGMSCPGPCSQQRRITRWPRFGLNALLLNEPSATEPEPKQARPNARQEQALLFHRSPNWQGHDDHGRGLVGRLGAARVKTHLRPEACDESASSNTAYIEIVLYDWLDQERSINHQDVELEAVFSLPGRHAGRDELRAEGISHIAQRDGVVGSER